jgi:hypothetical protein
MDKILGWLQERIKHRTKPAIPDLIIGILSDLTRSRADLMIENALLRQQMILLNRQIKRPQLTNPVILKNKLSSPWIVKRNCLAKFQLKTPKNLTDESSSQHNLNPMCHPE